jgi:NADH:ubiquinone oxidoreductase subunit H
VSRSDLDEEEFFYFFLKNLVFSLCTSWVRFIYSRFRYRGKTGNLYPYLC